MPEVEPEIDIIDPEPPLAEGVWALINLISAILTALGAIIALFRRKEDEDEDEEGEDNTYKAEDEEDEEEDDNRGKKMLAAKIAGALAGEPMSEVAFVIKEAGRYAVKNRQQTITTEAFEAALRKLPAAKKERSIGFTV